MTSQSRTEVTHEIEQELAAAEQQRGQGTELVSLYVPVEKNLAAVRQQIQNEQAQAENIKSDRTRKHVQQALQRVEQRLRQYSETPENGLVVFAGVVDGDLVEYVFDDLPAPIEQSAYTCSNEFVVEPLRETVAPSSEYGLLIVERGGAAYGSLRGEKLTVHQTEESHVMGKTKAGGQSAQRFKRERERQKHEFFTTVGETARTLFMDGDAPAVDGLLVGGTKVTVEDFLDGDYLHHTLEGAIVGGPIGVEYANRTGLEQLVAKGASAVQSAEQQAERELLDQFFSGIRDEDGAAYGVDEVETALEYGAVDTLLVSVGLPREDREEYKQAAKEIGADVHVVSRESERGEQFYSVFDGVGAVLRFAIN